MDLASVLFVGLRRGDAAKLRAELGDAVEVREAAGIAEAILSQRQRPAQVALVGLCGDGIETGLGCLSELRSSSVALVAVAPAKDPDLILAAVRAGARDVGIADEPRELARLVLKLARENAPHATRGRVTSVFGAKGGVGATTFAVNLAGTLAADGKSVVLVDLDVERGDVTVFLDLAASYTIADVLRERTRLDKDLLGRALPCHTSGLRVLAQGEALGDDDALPNDEVRPLIDFLAESFDHVVLDGVSGLDERSLTALDASDRVLLVVTQDVPALKNAERCLEVFRRLGYQDEKVWPVVNRLQRARIDVQAIADHLQVHIAGAVVDDTANVGEAVTRGRLVREQAPRARVTDDLADLAALVDGRSAQKRKRGLLDAIFGGRAPATRAAPTKAAPEADDADDAAHEDEDETANDSDDGDDDELVRQAEAAR